MYGITVAEFCYKASKELAENFSVQRFMELRYDVLRKEHPHEVFSVEQATPDFFARSYGLITGILKFEPETKDKPLSIYEKNYRQWINISAISFRAKINVVVIH